MAGDETAGQPHGGNGDQQGQPQQPQGQPQQPQPQPQPGGGLAPNVAAMLAYLLFGWIGGLIMFLTQSHPEVKFHAAQSIITFGGLTIINLLLGFIPFTLFLSPLLFLLGLVLWILLSIKGYNLEHFKLPVIGDYAEQMSGYQQATAQ